jgi:DNA polymerase I-like protein with 3'-5' exonuclease and polymerase domains
MTTLVFDIETNGFLEATDRVHSLVIRDLDSGTTYSCTDHPYSPDDPKVRVLGIEAGLRLLQDGGTIIGHNIIKFDIPAIQKVYPWFAPKGTVRDTLVLARLLWTDIADDDAKLKKKGTLPGNMIGRYGLEAFGYRLGCWKGDYSKVMRDQGLDPWAAWNPEMQSYCEQDVEVNTRLWLKALAKWKDTGKPEADRVPFADRSIDLEHRVAEIVARQERHGFAFDVKAAERLYLDLIQRRSELEDQLKRTFQPWWASVGVATVAKGRRVQQKQFKPIGVKTIRGRSGIREEPVYPVSEFPEGSVHTKIRMVEFNPSSRDHIADRLMRLRGWKPDEFGDNGKPTVDDAILNQLPWPEAKLIAEYLMIQKRIGQVAEGAQGWLKREKAGRIHGEVITNGAVTGRMTHNKPNVAQVPTNHAPYGERCRALFMASAGRMLVGCDADALELRCLAGYMALFDGGAYIDVVLKGDKKLGTDMHSVNARALGMDPKATYSIDGVDLTGRDIAKTWFYAFIYGAGDMKLGLIMGSHGAAATAAGKKSRAAFLRNLPALGKLTKLVKLKAKTRGFLMGLDGRKLVVRSQHAALNTLLQSAGAIIMKEALILLDDALGMAGLSHSWDYEFSANVHDEWQIDVREGLEHQVGALAADAIRRAGESLNFGCPLAGNYDVGRNWAETH